MKAAEICWSGCWTSTAPRTTKRHGCWIPHRRNTTSFTCPSISSQCKLILLLVPWTYNISLANNEDGGKTSTHRNGCNLGYAFVNFTTAAAARRLYGAMHRHEWKVFGSKKISHVCYARIQVGPFLLINRVPPLASYYLIRPALMLQLMPIWW